MFMVEFVFGVNRDERLAVRPAHREYLAKLAAEGTMVAAGPWANETGAVVIYDVADREALDRLLAEDPYTSAGVIAETRIREWQPILGAWLASRP